MIVPVSKEMNGKLKNKIKMSKYKKLWIENILGII